MLESLRLCDLSLILWVRWLMVDLAYLIFDPMSQLVVEYFKFECFLMVWSLFYASGLSFAPQKPSNWFTLFNLPSTLYTLQRFVIFYHSNRIIFTRIVCYDAYHVNNHPPNDFQVHIFSFDWILGVVTFQLSLAFHLIFSYPKTHGLTWEQGFSLLWFLKNLCL